MFDQIRYSINQLEKEHNRLLNKYREIKETKHKDLPTLLEENKRLKECLKHVQEELHYALNTDKDYDVKWYYVGNANRIIEETLKGGEANG